MNSLYDSAFWDRRYAGDDYVYGTAPNEFLAAVADRIPAGPVLCLAEGEGRNAVFLAGRGHAVTAVDQSSVGLAKATTLASRQGVPLVAVVADLATYPIAPGAWAGVVLIFVHLPPELRRSVLARAAAGLRRGGVVVLECYTPAQLAFATGGPREPALLPTLAELRAELPGLDFLHAAELERDIREGGGHTGRGAVAQIVARRPSS